MYNKTLLLSSDMAVEIVEDSPFITIDDLLYEEKLLVRESWSEARLKTFVLGRCAAHCALKALKREVVPVLRGEGGEPIWPAGIVGSISHKDRIAVAAVGRKEKYKGMGIDIEDLTIALSEKECSLFCTPAEMQGIRKKQKTPIDVFSCKEAILKAYYESFNKLCNWEDIDVMTLSGMPDAMSLHLFNKKNLTINLCCVKI